MVFQVPRPQILSRHVFLRNGVELEPVRQDVVLVKTRQRQRRFGRNRWQVVLDASVRARGFVPKRLLCGKRRTERESQQSREQGAGSAEQEAGRAATTESRAEVDTERHLICPLYKVFVWPSLAEGPRHRSAGHHPILRDNIKVASGRRPYSPVANALDLAVLIPVKMAFGQEDTFLSTSSTCS